MQFQPIIWLFDFCTGGVLIPPHALAGEGSEVLAHQNAACVAVPATTYQVTNRPQISAPGRLEPVRRQVKVAMTAAIASSGTNWMATMVESGTKPGSGSGLNSFPDSHSVPYCSPSSTMKPSVSA